jgi:DNA-binding MarR family transcriptional regulator
MNKINRDIFKINPSPDLISDHHHQLISNVVQLSNLIELIATKKISKELSFNQIKILHMIETGISIRSSDLAQQLQVTKANMTGMISRLEKNGFVQRKECEDDYRVKLLSLTEKGKEFIKSKRPEFFDFVRDPFSSVNDAKIIEANLTLDTLIDNLNELLD